MTPKARTLAHWLLDPDSGRPWATAEMVSLNLDLQERKALAMPDAVFDALSREITPGLGF